MTRKNMYPESAQSRKYKAATSHALLQGNLGSGLGLATVTDNRSETPTHSTEHIWQQKFHIGA